MVQGINYIFFVYPNVDLD